MPTTSVAVGHAHAKVILLGEHAVVYGAPAIALPVPNLTARATAARAAPGVATTRIDFPGVVPDYLLPADSGLAELVSRFAGPDSGLAVHVRSDIPPGRGLGSSAACARAIVGALGQLLGCSLTEAEVYSLVQSAERSAHGNPSGIDAAATGSPRPVVFSGGTAETLDVGMQGVFVVADSGDHSATRTAVDQVAERFRQTPELRSRFVRRAGWLAAAAQPVLSAGSASDLGPLLNENHALLAELGLSTPKLDRLVRVALDVGCTGAKITGGGLGGCVLTLVSDPALARWAAAALRAAGATATWTIPTETRG